MVMRWVVYKGGLKSAEKAGLFTLHPAVNETPSLTTEKSPYGLT
jgi:hypothetical protein